VFLFLPLDSSSLFLIKLPCIITTRYSSEHVSTSRPLVPTEDFSVKYINPQVTSQTSGLERLGNCEIMQASTGILWVAVVLTCWLQFMLVLEDVLFRAS
jgi:hypothetical protein